MIHRSQQLALYSLPANESDGDTRCLMRLAEGEALVESRRNSDILVMSRQRGESILLPSQGVTVQVAGIDGDHVRLQITVPAETKVFRLGIYRHPREQSGSE